jgi:hypothetical protein
MQQNIVRITGKDRGKNRDADMTDGHRDREKTLQTCRYTGRPTVYVLHWLSGYL